MRSYNGAELGLLFLSFLTLIGCVSMTPNNISIPEEKIREDFLYGYEIQTPFSGKYYVFAYGDIRIEGRVTTNVTSLIEGYSQRQLLPFRGNAEYKVEFNIGEDRLSGEINVELTCINISLDLNDLAFSGLIDNRTNKNYIDIVLGNSMMKGEYTWRLRISDRQLRSSVYSFDVSQGELPIVGSIDYGNDTYTYDLVLNRKTLDGTSSFGSSRNIYTIDADAFTTKELAVFLLINVLKNIHFDMQSYSDRFLSIKPPEGG